MDDARPIIPKIKMKKADNPSTLTLKMPGSGSECPANSWNQLPPQLPEVSVVVEKYIIKALADADRIEVM